MPTMGHLKFFLGRWARDVSPVVLKRADLFRLDVRERGEPLFGVRLATIALIMLIPP